MYNEQDAKQHTTKNKSLKTRNSKIRSTLCLDNYLCNMSNDLIQSLGGDYHENKDRFYFYHNGRDSQNYQIGNFTDIVDSEIEDDSIFGDLFDHDGKENTNPNTDSANISSNDNLVSKTTMYEILKCYLNTQMSDNINAIKTRITKVNTEIMKTDHNRNKNATILKRLFIGLLNIICPPAELRLCFDKYDSRMAYNNIEFRDLCEIFLGETMSTFLFNRKGFELDKVSGMANNHVSTKIFKFLLKLVDDENSLLGESCFLKSPLFGVYNPNNSEEEL